MSWSKTIIGTPEKVAEAFEAFGKTLLDQSKEEFNASFPHMNALIRQNIGKDVFIKVDASGHAFKNEGKTEYSSFSIKIEHILGTIAV